MLPQDKFQLVERVTLLTLASQLNCLSTLGLGILDLGKRIHAVACEETWRLLCFLKLLIKNQWSVVNIPQWSTQLCWTIIAIRSLSCSCRWHNLMTSYDTATMWSPRRRRFSTSTSLGTEFPSLLSLQSTGATWLGSPVGIKDLTEPKWDNWYERCEYLMWCSSTYRFTW